MMPRKGLPDRWNAYSAVGDIIPGTRFIAFKVPLKDHYFNEDFRGERFTPDDLVRRLGDKVSLVVDLSKKEVGGYYSPGDIEQHGLEYRKLAVMGRQVPTEKVCKRFAGIVRHFDKNHPADKFIGVHCTHGVNRTGYLITKYMVEHLQFTAEDALIAFEQGRGHPLERENYVAALRNLGRNKGWADDVQHVGGSGSRGQQGPAHGRLSAQPGHPSFSRSAHDSGWERGYRPEHGVHRGPSYNGYYPAPHYPPSRADLSDNWRERTPQEDGGMWGRSSHRGHYPIPRGGNTRSGEGNGCSSEFGSSSNGRVRTHRGGNDPASHHQDQAQHCLQDGGGSYSYHGNRLHDFQGAPAASSPETDDQWHQVTHKRPSKQRRNAHRTDESGQRGRGQFKQAAGRGQSQYKWTKEGHTGNKQGDKGHIHFQ